MLTVAFVPGVTLTKWTRVWAERHPGGRLQVSPTDDAAAAVRDGSADVGFVRLPIPEDGPELTVIRLYSEVPVAVLPKEHPLAQEDGVRMVDLAGERVLEITTTTKDAVEVVAAGAGVLLVPQSIARLNNRKDVVAVAVTDAPETTIAVIWLAAPADTAPADTAQRLAAIDDFIGIVRGRGARSSRGTPTPPTPRTKQSAAKQSEGKQKPRAPAKRRPPRPASGKRRRTW
ncbi:MAG: LysR substrate-binding domain-containing protein [Terrimesophilobacter sp.]